MTSGYVAFLDVLGFSALVARDPTGQLVREYLAALQQALENGGRGSTVEYVVFSDSIIATTKHDSADDFKAIVRFCSRLFALLLKQEIGIRGAISVGNFDRSESQGNNNVYVAGQAIIEAVEFEEKQKWLGVMLAPSVAKLNGEKLTSCSFPLLPQGGSTLVDDEWLSRFDRAARWGTFIQSCSIPFYDKQTTRTENYEGYAVVPQLSAEGGHSLARQSLQDTLVQLKKMRSYAPDPSVQAKYSATISWLSLTVEYWKRAEKENARRQA